jgi:hypothetical protein
VAGAAGQFTPATVRVINRHAARCAECAEERARVVDPETMFGAIPPAAAPQSLRQDELRLLAEVGVPSGVSVRRPQRREASQYVLAERDLQHGL